VFPNFFLASIPINVIGRAWKKMKFSYSGTKKSNN